MCSVWDIPGFAGAYRIEAVSNTLFLFCFFVHPGMEGMAHFIQWFAHDWLFWQRVDKIFAVAFAQYALI